MTARNAALSQYLQSFATMQIRSSWRTWIIDIIVHYMAPLALLGALLVYSKVAQTKNVPKPVYWITLVAGGFLLMSMLAI